MPRMSSLAEILRTSSDPLYSEAAPNALEPRPPENLRLIDEAEILGIPWQEILSREILAESTLQRFLGTRPRDLPLWRVVSILPSTFLHSWRSRDLMDRLFWEACAEGSRAARRQVVELLECLIGKRARRVREGTVRARHYWFAYNRVLELHAIALAGERYSGPPETRVAVLCEAMGAPRRDVEWAFERLTSPDRPPALDDAMARAREEGFEIPLATTEIIAFARLRRFVSRHPVLRPSRPAR
jgi:hypothetical protein